MEFLEGETLDTDLSTLCPHTLVCPFASGTLQNSNKVLKLGVSAPSLRYRRYSMEVIFCGSDQDRDVRDDGTTVGQNRPISSQRKYYFPIIPL